MYRIVRKEVLAPRIKSFLIEAPEIAAKAKPGHFVVVRLDEKGERIPLTIADYDAASGTIELVVQEVGRTTYQMGMLEAGQYIQDVVGPLGTPMHIEKVDCVVFVAGGLGVAPIYPKARRHYEIGSRVVSLIGAQNKDLLIMRDRMEKVSHEVRYSTDDGSFGHHGFVTELLKEMLDSGAKISEVVAVGPLVMMRAACRVTEPFGVKTIVSLNPIMVDGTGMCGSCRVTVGGETKFSCVDGPAFDGHKVDFGELIARQNRFLAEERLAMEHFTRGIAPEREECRCHQG
ncbi:MAG TPA: sulfide/dihydroorotate dehydrogenase-like FAD/NAD-binding protein [Firmicutes bacterium]|nr:sulfide/dihydroorotate dehydrogenase-like FAD/NAD-binding protein [Bacillota bacterium]